MVYPIATEFIGTGIGLPIKIVSNYADRVAVVITLLSVTGNAFLVIAEAGQVSDTITILTTAESLEIKRHDYGELATCELWVSDGSGGNPICDLIVTEIVET